ncbi:hypothetical protein QBC35DRAFT_129756 [Podospora australis]|uniref:Uncharacterized protein n=1 Tax=Podospora australis TaxID=1536484 RepID=A0AAN7AKU9_9PEZI|nr:hypothetical protein QBC35DRAFT_129756 [Podospora australis]
MPYHRNPRSRGRRASKDRTMPQNRILVETFDAQCALDVLLPPLRPKTSDHASKEEVWLDCIYSSSSRYRLEHCVTPTPSIGMYIYIPTLIESHAFWQVVMKVEKSVKLIQISFPVLSFTCLLATSATARFFRHSVGFLSFPETGNPPCFLSFSKHDLRGPALAATCFKPRVHSVTMRLFWPYSSSLILRCNCVRIDHSFCCASEMSSFCLRPFVLGIGEPCLVC